MNTRLAGILMSGAALCATHALAADVDAGSQVQEVVVTAQKRSQNLQDVGVAVTAIGQAGLAALGRQDVTGLANQVPSLQVNQYSPTVTVFNIRGISQNDFADSQEAPIAFYNDDVYVSALGAISGSTYDLQRIEVLRGPQGTLFGRNATGGLIHIFSAQPTADFQGFLTVTAQSHGEYTTEGAVSGPLTDHLRGRLSFTTNNGGAYIKNLDGPELGAAAFYAGRIQLAGDIGDTGSFNLKLEGLRNNHDRQGGLYSHAAAVPNAQGLGEFIGPHQNPWNTCAGCDALGFRSPSDSPFVASFNGPNYFDRSWWGVTAHYNQDIGDLKLASVTNYQALSKLYGEDSDMSPASNFQYTTDQHLYQLSQEIRLSQDTDRLHWVAGVYALKVHTWNRYVTDTTGAFGLREDYRTILNTESLATFGQAEYKLNDQFSIIAGARASKDWKNYDYDHAENGVHDFTFNSLTFSQFAKLEMGNYSAKGEIDYKPNRNAFFYVSVNRGTKSGGFGTPVFPPFDPSTIPFKSEVLTNFEAGMKLTLFDRTSHLNAAAFHYDYHNYQSFETVGVALTIRNKPAEVNGLEVEFNTQPIHGLYLQTFATFLDATVRKVTLPAGDVVNRRMPQAPKVSFGMLGRYAFDVGPGEAAVQTDWKYDGRQYFSTFNAPVDLENSRVIGNVRISYTLDKPNVELAAFVNNVTNKSYRVYNLDLSGPFGFTQQTFARPRWYGVSLSYHFN